jgi:peptidylprolyl isomerase
MARLARAGAGALAFLAFAGCGGGGPDPEGPPLPPSDPALLFFAPELDIDLSEFERTSSGLYVQDIQVGEGPIARRTSRVWIHYVGWLPDGTLFDGSLGGDPYHTRLGGSEVIRGWNEGITGMRRGGIRRLVVPPNLGYGSRGQGDVPPGATLVFQLELVDVD